MDGSETMASDREGGLRGMAHRYLRGGIGALRGTLHGW